MPDGVYVDDPIAITPPLPLAEKIRQDRHCTVRLEHESTRGGVDSSLYLMRNRGGHLPYRDHRAAEIINPSLTTLFAQLHHLMPGTV